MLYEVYLQMADTSIPVLWLRTKDKEQTQELLKKAKAMYIYVRIFDNSNVLLNMECQKEFWNTERSYFFRDLLS